MSGAMRKQRRTDGNEVPLTGELGLLGAILDRAIKDAQGFKMRHDVDDQAQLDALEWLADAEEDDYEPPEPWSCRWILEQVDWPDCYRRRIMLVVHQSQRGVLSRK